MAVRRLAFVCLTALVVLGSASPAERIKLERYGKSSVVLARCGGIGEAPVPDQSRYEPLFAAAASVLSSYRGLLGARTLVPEELNRLGRSAPLAAKESKAPNGK